jgi:AraC-like DNA-binding protein
MPSLGISTIGESDRLVHRRVLHRRAHDDGVNCWATARIAPPRLLAGGIDAYEDYRERTGGFTTRREVPHAEAVLIINLGEPIAVTGGDGHVLHVAAGEGFVAGAHLRPALSRSGGAQSGMHVRLPLTTLRRMLGLPMTALMDRVVPLDALLGVQARALGLRLGAARDLAGRVAVLDDALSRRLAATPRLGRQQDHAVRLLRDRPEQDIAGIARDIGWSRKHFAARVQDAVGVGPRCFRRLLRFQNLTALIGGADGSASWAGLAQDAGYCDQSHMIREFREFSGLTPGAYRALLLPDGGGVVEA